MSVTFIPENVSSKIMEFEKVSWFQMVRNNLKVILFYPEIFSCVCLGKCGGKGAKLACEYHLQSSNSWAGPVHA